MYNVDIEIISTTKSISGGGTSVGGAITIYDSNKWNKVPKVKEFYSEYGKLAIMKKLIKEVYRNLGACLSPHNAYFQILGLETMSLRIDKSCDNALKVSEYLEEEKRIKSVNYPGLRSNKYNGIVKKQFRGIGGSLLTFELDSKDKCFRFINALKMIRRSTNLCENKTLIIHPSSTIFCEYSNEEKRELGVNDRMIRLSIGIEDGDDIIEDISLLIEIQFLIYLMVYKCYK